MCSSKLLPLGFKSDGCSGIFDKLFSWDMHECCVEHDVAYCSRVNPPGSMTYAAKIRADMKLEECGTSILPWWLDWTAWWVYMAVVLVGPFNTYDSCGPEVGEHCRHAMKMPPWMLTGGADGHEYFGSYGNDDGRDSQ